MKNVRKAKILYLLDIFQRKTDKEKGLTITDIFDELYLRGITAERKSIYSDISALREAGFEIEKRKTEENVTYHLLGGNLSGGDLRDLCVIVLASPFISKKSSNDFVMKLADKTTEQNGQRILGSMFRFFNFSESNIYVNIVSVSDAILDLRKVSFTYKGVKTVLSPYSVVTYDGSLYLAGGSRSFDDGVECFDFSYITDVSVLDRKISELADVTENPDFNIKEFIKGKLVLPVGKEIDMCFEVEENEIPVFMDEFDSHGLISDNDIEKSENGFFTIHVTSKITPERLAYLYKNGDRINVISPSCICEKLLRIDKLVKSF